MGMVVERGFTVIELMLFLAISGLLLVGLMVGVGNNITQQRYRDEVVSFKSLIQNQYSEVLTPQNVSSQVICDGAAADDRGTTDCVILGRAIQIDNDGSRLTISNVVGSEPAELDFSKSDLDALKEYNPAVVQDDNRQVENLNDVIRNTKRGGTGGGPASVTILILRSPVSGLMKVFGLTDMSNGLDSPAANLSFCVGGDTGSMPRQVVSLNPNIAGSGAITSRDANTGECA